MKCLTKNGVAICAALNLAEEMADLTPQAYSGKGMFGEQCVGVALESTSELFYLGRALHGIPELQAPRVDSLGRGFIAYWPACKVKT